jgi:hypothetical protein
MLELFRPRIDKENYSEILKCKFHDKQEPYRVL